MSVTKHLVAQWTDKAQTTLKTAQELCSSTEKSLVTINHQLLEKLPQKLQENDDIVQDLKKLHHLTTHYIDFINVKITTDTIGRYNSKYTKLETRLQELQDVLQQLHHTKVPAMLIDDNYNPLHQPQYSLQDFISMEEISMLLRNIKIYHNNMVKMHTFMHDSYQETVVMPFNTVITRKYNKILKLNEAIIVEHSMNNDILTTIVKENGSLEQELVSILQMLTNHYDQCMIGLRSFDEPSNDAHASINFQILENDSLEVPEVLKDLKSVCDIIVNNEIRSKKIISTIFDQCDELHMLMNDLNKIYGKFKSTNLFQLIVFLSKYDEFVKHSSIESMDYPLDSYYHAIDQLIYHYQQFLSIFKTKYLVELHHQQFTYPRKFMHKLNQFLNDELYSFQQDERDRRNHWLKKYGDFIPKQFKLPGEIQPSVVQVITDGIDDENVQQEKQLLDIIKSVMHKPNTL